MGNTQTDVILGFCTSQSYEVQSQMFVRSLREFGGEMSNLPVWALFPESQPLGSSFEKALSDLDVSVVPFVIDKKFSHFPFALKTSAAAQAEKLAEGQNAVLAWHDRTGIILNQPESFYLPDDIAFGYRPTDIANIGAPFGRPFPPFWEVVCDHCTLEVPDFPSITTVIDQIDIYLYINAGLLVVHPEKKILRRWEENLLALHALPIFRDFYKENSAYAIFMHQAALTAAVIQKTSLEERLILPDDYLFSVDNFFDYPVDLRPRTLDEIVTGRFHDFFALDHWENLINASEELKNWFREQLKQGLYWPKTD